MYFFFKKNIHGIQHALCIFPTNTGFQKKKLNFSIYSTSSRVVFFIFTKKYQNSNAKNECKMLGFFYQF